MTEHAPTPQQTSDSYVESTGADSIREESSADEPSEPARPTSSPRVVARARLYFRRNAIALIATFVPSCVAGTFVSDEFLDSRLPRGMRVLGVDVSRSEPGPAKLAVERAARIRLDQPLAVALSEKHTNLIPRAAGFRFDVDKLIELSLRERRGRGPLVRVAAWAQSLFGELPETTPVLSEDAASLAQALDTLERSQLELPSSGGFRLEKDRIVPEYPHAGRALDRAAATDRLRAALLRGEHDVSLPVRDVKPAVDRGSVDHLVERARQLSSGDLTLSDASGTRRLTLHGAELARSLRVRVAEPNAAGNPELYFDGEALLAGLGDRRAPLENAAKSARFVVHPDDRVELQPSEAELRLEKNSLAAAVQRAAMSEGRSGELPLERGVEPELTTEQARALSIKGKVSTFTTRHPCCERRVDNIHRIADLLDGLIVKPGETVSVNAIIGPRTTKNGFVPAPTIEEGEMVETIGGGISQFATTFFNALFYGGYDIIERQPHTYWFPRYPMGHEATLSYPHPDLVFRNDTDAGMLIHTAYTKTTITVSIYGDNGGRRVRAEVSDRKDIVKPTIEIIPNPAVPPDKEHTLQGGMIGWSVMVGRVIQFPDGTKKEERRKVTYKPKVRRVEVHPCRVPEGEKGYTGEKCPEPADSGDGADGTTASDSYTNTG